MLPPVQHVMLLFLLTLLLTLVLTAVNCENSEGASLGEEPTFLMVLVLPYVGAILETFSLW